MKQIAEDYVSYEIAKLLKEKGVDFIDCVTYYCEDKPKEVNYSFCGETNSTWEKRCCQAPTHQMVLKWLRDVHRKHICIRMRDFPTQYEIEVYDTKTGYLCHADFEHSFDSYEEAVEAAIKYTLENLI